ncbi:MAG: chemotaxis protein CheW [Pseudochelatococcus sp.]|jgi:two-component system chemotaxis sensor kinase CheA|uniref:hybrid sensor histidine kinase/response regulator n=1 Tax=Pseudochelatococcus sp. TaxID=2020869 RepID=UPI003D8F7803
MDDLLREFLTEATESLDLIDAELVKFERDPNNADILSNIFRLVHTIKGTCGFLGLPRLGSLAHAAETLMGRFREGAEVRPEAVDLVMRSIDRIKDIVGGLEAGDGNEPDGDDGDLISALNDMAEKAEAGAPAVPEEPPAVVPVESVSAQAEGEDAGGEDLDELERLFRETPVDPRPASGGAREAAGSLSVKAEKEAGKSAQVAVRPPAAAEPAPLASREAPAAHGEDAGAPARSGAAQSIRVNVETLEQLMTMVSELVLTRNQLLDLVRRQEESEFKVPLQRLSHVTAELQEAVMKTRMQPIGNAWQKLPRIVRDLSRDLGKPIDLQMLGADTELDRQVLEMIKDPLTHMIRNSADHGLESPEDRVRAGKREAGTIRLSAYHEGGHIIIEVGDDGRGLNTERIREKAVNKGLVSAIDAEKMSDAQIHAFIFHPGFSTAEVVTNVSGRGVGMDVVRTNIELIGGSVNVLSRRGQGSTFLIKIPLTLAIVSALIVEAATERFAIPQLAVVELVRVQKGSEHRIERFKDAPVLRLREKLLPIVYLDQLLGIGTRDVSEEDDSFVVVMQVGNRAFGIGVDNVLHTEEIVVKPVSSILRHVSMFSGTTILGDGSVIMIIDPNSMAQAMASGLVPGVVSGHDEEPAGIADGAGAENMSLILFRAGTEEPKAVPLSLVTRLEVFDAARIERLTGQDLVQYRGSLMPLVYISDASRDKVQGERAMLVFTDHGKAIGLVVDEIIDIVDESFTIEFNSTIPGILGTAVVKGRATEILDIGHFLPATFRAVAGPRATNVASKPRVLFVDDSAFFRNMLSPMLRAAGYDVTVCESVRDAYGHIDAGMFLDVVVSDIDMPEIDGFTFVEKLRADPRTRDLPVIALSGLNTPEAIERGRKVGFTDYIAKFDKEGLLAALEEFTASGTGVTP